jgi:acyl dehydratase
MKIDKSRIAEFKGYQVAPTAWHLVDQQQINAFADCTLDRQFIHVDPQLAAQTPFGGTIAHGFLTLSMLSHFAEQFGIEIEGAVMGVNYGFDKIRFISPVKVGQRIRASTEFIEIIEKAPGQFLSRMNVVIEIEGGTKPALTAEWLGMQFVN